MTFAFADDKTYSFDDFFKIQKHDKNCLLRQYDYNEIQKYIDYHTQNDDDVEDAKIKITILNHAYPNILTVFPFHLLINDSTKTWQEKDSKSYPINKPEIIRDYQDKKKCFPIHHKCLV